MEFGIFILMQQRGYHQTSADVLHAAVEQTVPPIRQVSTRPGTPSTTSPTTAFAPSPLMMVAHGAR